MNDSACAVTAMPSMYVEHSPLVHLAELPFPRSWNEGFHDKRERHVDGIYAISERAPVPSSNVNDAADVTIPPSARR